MVFFFFKLLTIKCTKQHSTCRCHVIASNRFLRCQRCYHIFKVISAEENNSKDVVEEQNKYKPPPIPKEVSINYITLVDNILCIIHNNKFKVKFSFIHFKNSHMLVLN